MSINDQKTVKYDKPIITEITIAKKKIKYLLKNNVGNTQIEDDTESDMGKIKLYLNSSSLITNYKIIINEAGTCYKDVNNYTFGLIQKKLSKIISSYANYDKKSLSKFIKSIIEFIFFIYSSAPMVTHTIKLCMSISEVILFLRLENNGLESYQKEAIKKSIFDEISSLLSKFAGKQKNGKQRNSIETFYLLIYLRELGRDYLLEESALCKYLNIDHGETQYQYNYFSIIVILFYIKDNRKYTKIMKVVKEQILLKLSNGLKWNRMRAENTLLFFDLIVCPYLDRKFKNKLFELNGCRNNIDRDAIMAYKKYWFTRWDNIDPLNQIFKKKGIDVY